MRAHQCFLSSEKSDSRKNINKYKHSLCVCLTCFPGVVYVIPDERNSQETNKEIEIGKRRFIREHNNNIGVHMSTTPRDEIYGFK